MVSGCRLGSDGTTRYMIGRGALEPGVASSGTELNERFVSSHNRFPGPHHTPELRLIQPGCAPPHCGETGCAVFQQATWAQSHLPLRPSSFPSPMTGRGSESLRHLWVKPHSQELSKNS